MNTTNIFFASAVAAALTLAGAAAFAGPAEKPSFAAEKCFGVAKASKNDCQTAASSCAGTSKRDAQGDAWIYTPTGLCTKLIGGSLEAKKS